jgi:hypothetical protein
VETELGKEQYNERSEERGWHREGNFETASKSTTSLALPRQDIVVVAQAMDNFLSWIPFGQLMYFVRVDI